MRIQETGGADVSLYRLPAVWPPGIAFDRTRAARSARLPRALHALWSGVYVPRNRHGATAKRARGVTETSKVIHGYTGRTRTSGPSSMGYWSARLRISHGTIRSLILTTLTSFDRSTSQFVGTGNSRIETRKLCSRSSAAPSRHSVAR